MTSAISKELGRGTFACKRIEEAFDRLREEGIAGSFADQLIGVFGQYRKQLSALRRRYGGAAGTDGQLTFASSPAGNNLFVRRGANFSLTRPPSSRGA